MKQSAELFCLTLDYVWTEPIYIYIYEKYRGSILYCTEYQCLSLFEESNEILVSVCNGCIQLL